MKNILHLTDFHVRDPESSKDEELLRRRFYREYIDNLSKAISTKIESLDSIVITGDFVDRGNVANAPHCANVIDYLCSSLKVSIDSVFLCMGNHDIVRDKESAGLNDEARSDIRNLIKRYGRSSLVRENGRASLYKLETEGHVLMLDATLGRIGDNPCRLKTEEVDELVEDFVRSVPSDQFLIIGSHYPADVFPGDLAGLYPDEPGFHDRHFWLGAAGFRERLANIRDGALTVWVAGDIHRSDQIRQEGLAHIVTGRFGVPPSVSGTILSRQARVIKIGDRSEVLVDTWEFKMPTHIDQGMVGSWEISAEGIAPRTIGSKKTNQKKEESIDSPTNMDSGGAHEEPPLSINPRVTCLDSDLDNELMKIIEVDGLFRLGRFRTAEDMISLGWVSIGPLMNSPGILNNTVEKLSQWLGHKCQEVGVSLGDEVVLFGVDCWGAVVAAHLSVKTGAKNFCVAARAKGKYHSQREKVSESVITAAKAASMIVFVTDVVATGGTIKYVHSELIEKGGIESEDKVWILASIVNDEKSSERSELGFVESMVAGCTSLRLPRISPQDLPDESILPPSVSFI